MRSTVYYLAATGISIALLTSACGGDGQSGIPTDPPDPPATSATPVTTPAPVTTTTPAPTTTVAPGPPVGNVPNEPEAAPAVKAWANDLLTGNSALVTAKCWTVPPTEIAGRYRNVPAILSALKSPGVAGPLTITWSDATTAVSIDRSDAFAGYACPAVSPAGSDIQLTDADATYTVARYLGRAIGEPVNPADVEAVYPLVCAPTPDWDPRGTGMPIVPPITEDRTLLDASIAFDPSNMNVSAIRAGYVDVTADVTDVSSEVITRTLTLDVRGNGYCIGDVT